MYQNPGAQLRYFRLAKDLTLQQASSAIGVSISAWRKWELGRSTPNIRYISDMANILGIKPHDLVSIFLKEA